MKRMWRNCLAIIALATMVGSANAQNDWNQPAAIGSYQSILSRAGYGNSMGSMGQAMMQPGVPMQGSTMQGGAMMQGGMVQGGMVQGGAMAGTNMGSYVGSPTVGVPMASGQVMSSAPMMSAPVNSAPMMSSPAIGYGAVDMGNSCGVGVSAPIYNGVVGGVMGQSACSEPVYSSPVYQPACAAPAAKANYTVGLTGLFFQRDYEDNRYLARNPSGDTLNTNDADDGTFDGFGVNVASRNANGGGFEVGYWALNPGRTSSVLTGANVATNIRGFDRLTHVSSGRDLLDIYSNTTAQTIVRDTDINNLEFNMLRNGGSFCTRGNRRGFYELLGGFRWFEFDESLQYGATVDTAAYPASPSDFFYNLEARNRLLGLQLGARNELCFGSKLRLFTGVKGGIFNNNIRTIQNLTDTNGEIAQINAGSAAGRPFSYNDEKNDVAFLGELDFGFLYHLSCRSRIRLGYRALGVSGVALAADQMPFDYSDPNELSRANSNGGLLLHGGYYGLEFCF